MNVPVIETRNLEKHFKISYGTLHAVDGVSLKIEKGKTLGIVGESGCGKSTLGKVILRLQEPTGGSVLYNGRDINSFSKTEMLKLCQKMQIIFQDPYSSINPRMTVAELIAEPILINKIYTSKKGVSSRIKELMDLVGLASRLARSYPHELDGGRRQRIGVARALSVNPDFIVCDEPVSALDVSIQAQILNLLMDLQDNMGLTYMFITHDLSVVKHISQDIAVMYLGKCVEYAATEDLFKNPLHPYTKALLGSIPRLVIETRTQNLTVIKGELTSSIDPKPGCRFAQRCPHAGVKCLEDDILLRETNAGHFTACILI
jgi:peptide/nickel transport system ATP-binding protein